MNLEAELTLSFYKEISDIGKTENVKLVKHIETGVLYVKKTLSVYDADLYKTLKDSKLDGIPEIHHIIETNNELIIIEEYINGRTLQQELEANGPFDIDIAVHIIKTLCSILNNLHSLKKPIIHRDIKPSNIIMSDRGEITLIDFNVSRKYDVKKSQDTMFMGTADYAAPEQYGFGQSDARTDIYALGQLLNVLLTGFLPKEQLYTGKAEKIISRCINLDPERRYRSTMQLSHALACMEEPHFEMTNGPVSFLPPGFRSKKPWKMIIAVFGYILLLYFIITMEFVDVITAIEAYIYRLYLLICGLYIIAFSTNYLNIRYHLPLGKNRYVIVRILSAVCWLIIILFITGFMAAIISTALNALIK